MDVATGRRSGNETPERPLASAIAPLLAALAELADASEAMTRAVQRRDLDALAASCRQAQDLTDRVEALSGDLGAFEPGDGQAGRLRTLRDRLATVARRNALLIEQAWALDAATMRLIVGFGRAPDAGAAGFYASIPSSAWVDRQA